MTRSIGIIVSALFALSACGGSPVGSFTALDHSALAANGCVTNRYEPPRAPAYANTIWPTEKHDQWRTAATAGGLPAQFRSLHTRSLKLPPVPVWGYVGVDGNLYVMGGQPYLLDVYTKLILGSKQSAKQLLAESLAYSETVTPYIARINPTTMTDTILTLPRKHGVNYIGGMLVDSDGYLYAVARAVLYKIDPASFRIVAWKRLPLVPNASGQPDRFTTYNGMQATLDGDLILKGFPSFGSATGILVKVDPADLSIKAQTTSTAIAGARLAVATSGNREYIYTAGATDSIRFLVKPSSFVLDTAFSQQYLQPSSGSTEGTSEVYMGNGVIFTNNTAPDATTPMTVFAQAASDGSTLASEQAFSSSAKGWNWEMPSGDPYRSGIAAIQDQLSGDVSGFRVCDGGASTVKLWENDSIAESIGMAIDVQNGQLYADDHHCAKHVCTLSFVVLNSKTGQEIGRTVVAGSEPSTGQIFIGPNNAVFHLATDTDRPNGYITRVTAR